MNQETKASFRVALLMAAFVGVAAALSLALGNGTENVWVPAGPGEQHQDASAVHTATAVTIRPASRTEPRIPNTPSSHLISVPALLNAQRQLI